MVLVTSGWAERIRSIGVCESISNFEEPNFFKVFDSKQSSFIDDKQGEFVKVVGIFFDGMICFCRFLHTQEVIRREIDS